MQNVTAAKMFGELDPLLHSQVRLSIMSILISVKSAEFSFLLENINTTKGNLSFQLNKLKEGEYIEIKKSLKGNYPLTTCEITEKGIIAYENYVETITGYFKKFKYK
jgi:DNA-binding transcriptional ArsR family regulator